MNLCSPSVFTALPPRDSSTATNKSFSSENCTSGDVVSGPQRAPLNQRATGDVQQRAGNKRKPSRLAFLVFLFFAGPFSTLAAGQSVSAGGLQFPVESIVQADRETVKVTIFGDTFLVNSERLPQFVVSQYLNRPDKLSRFNGNDLQRLISTSVSEGNEELAVKVLSFLLAEPTSRLAEGLERFIVTLAEGRADSSSVVNVLRRTLLQSDKVLPASVPLAAVLFYAGQHDVEWLKSRAVAQVFRCSNELRYFVEERFAAAASFPDNAHGEKLADFALRLFGPQEPLFVRLRMVCNRIADLKRAVEGSRPEKIFPLLKSEADNPLLSTVLVPMAMGELHKQAKQALSSGQADKALEILGWVSPSLRTPLTHELTLEALRKFRPGEGSFLGDRPTAFFLKNLAFRRNSNT